MMIDETELGRLRQIEKLAWEVVKPALPQEHQEALTALHEALLNENGFRQGDVRRRAITMRIIDRK
jgi:hypothetical protein